MKKSLFLLLTLLVGAPLADARPEFASARRSATPYDPYMGSVRSVLRGMDGGKPSFEQVSALLRKGYDFRYVYETPYYAPTPAQTEARGAGDCKAKSLWLAAKMNDPSVRYVIGKARRDSPISHAWLMWRHNNQWWVLDPTNLSRPVPANKVSRDEYIISYSYGKGGSYTHAPAQGRRAVAGQRR